MENKKMENKDLVICLVGLGYVGLPLAVKFGLTGIKTIGFDVSEKKVSELKRNIDTMNEVSSLELEKTKVEYTTDASKIKEANFIIVAVPTPVDNANNPDITLLKRASKTIGENLQKESIIVYESTVYPGCTEEDCIPEIEAASGLKWKKDFNVGYSPERINPGDKEHTIDKIVKVVSGDTTDVCDIVADVYNKVVTVGTYKASSIKVAEAAKVIENTQRDINIALMNELAIIFDKMNINTYEVLAAAGTKWNFLKFTPGLVGGHCIGVDPYYLVHKAKKLGIHAQMITAGRKINDSMSLFVASNVIKMLINSGKKVKGAKVLLFGLTFKENVNDMRNSKAFELINELKEFGIEVIAHDPYLSVSEVENEFGVLNISIKDFNKFNNQFDGMILVTSHNEFKNFKFENLRKLCNEKPVFYDIRNMFDSKTLTEVGFEYKSL